MILISLTTIASLWLTSVPSLSVQPMAFTYHGLISDAELEQIKERGDTLSHDGRWTYHTGAGIMARWHFVEVDSIYFRNSFNEPSGAVMAGPKYSLGQYASMGVVVGAYARKSIEGMKMPIYSYQTKSVEVAPMAMVTASLAIPLYKHLYFEANVGTNWVLNFFTPGLRMVF